MKTFYRILSALCCMAVFTTPADDCSLKQLFMWAVIVLSCVFLSWAINLGIKNYYGEDDKD